MFIKRIRSFPRNIAKSIKNNIRQIWLFFIVYAILMISQIKTSQTSHLLTFMTTLLIMLCLVGLNITYVKARNFFDSLTSAALTSLVSAAFLVILNKILFTGPNALSITEAAMSGVIIAIVLFTIRIMVSIARGSLKFQLSAFKFIKKHTDKTPKDSDSAK